MPEPIRYSPAPNQAPWYERLLSPLVLAGNLLVAAVAYPGLHTGRVSWGPELESFLTFLRGRTRPVVLYCWHAYELPVLCVVYRLPSDVRPVGIGHDGVLSRIFQRAVAWMGIPVWVYRRRSTVRPGQQIIDMIQDSPEPPILGLVPDAGGPYGRIKPGILRIAQATGAHLVPVAVRTDRVFLQKRPAPYLLPLPFSEISVHYGAPLDGATASMEDARKALEAVDAKAHAIWSGQNG
jgi:lysophospholipid acyltransferase (LPLAT)-like uncharacterized protein